MSQHFTLDIRLGNDAMQTGDDIAAALRIAADQVESAYDGDGKPSSKVLVWDANGNSVGLWEIAEPDTQAEATAQGTIKLADGTTSEFLVHLPDSDRVADSWQQWGASQDRLWRTTDLVTALQDAAIGWDDEL